MNQQASRAIVEALKKVTPIKLEGQYRAQVSLTPHVVKKISNYEGGYKPPSFLTPRCEFKCKPAKNSEAFENIKWTNIPVTTGIYRGGLNFPEFCCICMRPVEKYEVIQLGITKRGGTLQLPFTDREQAELISDAIFLDRFWYTIPFCNEDSLGSEGISFKETDTHFIIGFINREYGKLFGELNKMEGMWINKSTILARTLFKFRLVISIFAILMGALFTLVSFAETTTTAQQSDVSGPSLFWSLVLLLSGIGVFGWSLFFWIKHRKGENL